MKYSTKINIETLTSAPQAHLRRQALKSLVLGMDKRDLESFFSQDLEDSWRLSIDSLEININKDGTCSAFDSGKFLAAA